MREENDALRAKLSKLEPTQTLTELNLSLAVSMSDEEGSSVVLSPREYDMLKELDGCFLRTYIVASQKK